MERLTEKYDLPYFKGYDHIYGRDFVNFKDDYNEVFNKLGKLEDIEEELGIPLEVLFKALKYGIIIDDEEYQTFLMYDEVTNSYCFKCGGWNKYFLKDYGWTWSLTKEELE